jgi:hypothetical protein
MRGITGKDFAEEILEEEKIKYAKYCNWTVQRFAQELLFKVSRATERDE